MVLCKIYKCYVYSVGGENSTFPIQTYPEAALGHYKCNGSHYNKNRGRRHRRKVCEKMVVIIVVESSCSYGKKQV